MALERRGREIFVGGNPNKESAPEWRHGWRTEYTAPTELGNGGRWFYNDAAPMVLPENSPAFQGWVKMPPKINESRQGRQNRGGRPQGPFVPNGTGDVSEPGTQP